MPPPESGRSRVDVDLSDSEALHRMHRITSSYERSYEERLRDLLDLGRTYLGVQAGFLTEISEDTQLIVEASGNHDLLQPGESCPLSKAYCRKTVNLENALTVQHAALGGWEGDAAYERFGLESYIGSKVVVDGDVYGTFCFADEEPRETPFSDEEETFVELMAEWVSYEVSQQRATERIERQRDQLEEFASVVSHDLRNPLGVVEGYLDLAEQTGDPEHFDRCRNALERMNSLIDDLLVLAREGDSIAGTESIALADLIADCWEMVVTENATLELESDATITGDWSRVQQLFENLFRNSVEHGSTGSRPKADDGVEHGSTSNRTEPGDSGGQGGDDVTVRVGTLDDASGIYVEDDGPGIPPGKREQIFDETYSTAESGSGFGMAIVKQIADAHGWTVRVTESDAGGARFEISGVELST